MVETEIKPDLSRQFDDRERNTDLSLHCGPDRPGTISDSLFQLVPYFSIAFLRSWKQRKHIQIIWLSSGTQNKRREPIEMNRNKTISQDRSALIR